MNRQTEIPFKKKKVDDLIIIPTSRKFEQPPNKLMAPFFFKPPSSIKLPFDIESKIPESWIEQIDFGEPCISKENFTVLLNQLLKERKDQLEEEYRNQKSAFCDNYARAKQIKSKRTMPVSST